MADTGLNASPAPGRTATPAGCQGSASPLFHAAAWHRVRSVALVFGLGASLMAGTVESASGAQEAASVIRDGQALASRIADLLARGDSWDAASVPRPESADDRAVRALLAEMRRPTGTTPRLVTWLNDVVAQVRESVPDPPVTPPQRPSDLALPDDTADPGRPQRPATGNDVTGNQTSQAIRKNETRRPTPPPSPTDTPRHVPAPSGPEAEDALALTGPHRWAVQQVLNDLGYHAGPETGVFGPPTRAAIRAFQRSVGLPADGYLTEETLASLLRARPAPTGPAHDPFLTWDRSPPGVLWAPEGPAEAPSWHIPDRAPTVPEPGTVRCMFPDGTTQTLPRQACHHRDGVVFP